MMALDQKAAARISHRQADVMIKKAKQTAPIMKTNCCAATSASECENDWPAMNTKTKLPTIKRTRFFLNRSRKIVQLKTLPLSQTIIKTAAHKRNSVA